MNRFYKLFLLLVLIAVKVNGQSYDFRHYQVEQGLSYNSVFGILQDSKGFMWFAAKDGLNRFDGYNFKIFRHDPTDSTSIGSNLNLCLYEDPQQTLWIGTSKGLYKYNDTLERFSVVPGTLNKYIVDIKADKQGKMFLLFDGRIHTYEKRTKQLRLLSKKQDFSASSMLFTSDGTLWVSASDGYLKRYNAKDDAFETFNVFEHSTSVSAHWIDRIYLTKSNSILIGTSHQGVKLFDIKSLTYKDILTFNADRTPIFAKNFIHYEADTYWIATESGIFIYNLKTGAYTQLKKDHDNPYALSDNAIYTFAKDREGGIWAGTYFGGVNYYPKPFTAFEKHFAGSSVFPISGNAVREIDTDKYGNLWVATEDAGLNKISPSGKVQLFKPGAGINSIAHTNIHGILAVDNELWIGTYEQGLDVLDIPTGKVIRHYNKGKGRNDIKSNFVETIYKTRNGMLLLGTSYGLVNYNRVENNFKPLEGFPQEHHYMCIIEDENGTIWAGTIGNGLFYYNPGTGAKGEYQAGNPKSISDNFINSLFIDRDRRLWVTTENGLNSFDAKRKTFTRYGTKDGFPSNVFYRIEQDIKSRLWLSTAKGLVSFNPNAAGKSIKVYTKETGLLSDQFNYNSSYVDHDGKLYFGSVNGMIAFNPLKFSINSLAPSIYVTGFQVFNKDLIIGGGILKKSINFTDKIDLEYDQSTFSIDFAALTYTDFGTAAYEYKLEGVDKSYTYLSKNRRVFYTKLSPGSYTFSVRGSNSSGVWTEGFRKLVIVIHPPFYKTYWAYAFYILIAATLIWCILVFLRKRQLEKDKRKLEALENRKEREIYQAKADSFTHLITIAQSKPDQALLNKLNDFILDNLSDTNMDVDQLAESLNMSRATFYRKVKAISNLTPNELINITRLKKAAELLLNTDLKIQQIASQTGFSSQAQFGRSFAKQFGMSPTEYSQNNLNKRIK
ncbi:MAG: helix-turn-helix domain-containing protein [Pedobacter sp.]|nr:MAG: helix-turn-helix domain-containing protein [Pedobacter sp.]